MLDHVDPDPGLKRPAPRRGFLYAIAFAVGTVIMAAELAAGRLVAPFYGTSTLVWALLIGAVLSSMALGQMIGGRMSRRTRTIRPLAALLLASALLLAVLPVLARPIMQGSLEMFRHGAFGTLVASAFGVTLLLALPIVTLGATGPVLIHHAVDDREGTGQIAGRLYALGSAGSLVGTYLAGLVLVPLVGTSRTLWGCAALMGLLGLLGLLRGPRRTAAAAGVAALAALGMAVPLGQIKERRWAVYEAETPYNYLQVTDDGAERRLYLNDGYAVQSIYQSDGGLPLRSVWGYYALSPSWTEGGRPERVLLLGLGGGTSARAFRELYPDVELTGVEIDPGVVEAGRRFFGLPGDVRVVTDDARAFLARDDGRYDVIVVDAFQFPYVPFQLCTREFFELVDAHLEPGGAVVLNVGRDRDSREVVDAVARTMGEVFDRVRGVDVFNHPNTILVGTRHPADRDAGVAGLGLDDDAARRLAGLPPVRPVAPPAGTPVLTDDVAPVELLTDLIVLRLMWGTLTEALGG